MQRTPDDLDRRATLIRQRLGFDTSENLRLHLQALRSALSGNKARRGATVAEFAKLDARAVPMLVDLCFFEDDVPQKAKRSAAKALSRIRDPEALSYLACYLRDWDLGRELAPIIREIDAAVEDDAQLTDADWVRLLVGLRRGDLLRELLNEAEGVLLGDLFSGTAAAAKFALWALIGLGESSFIPKLVESLERHGSKTVAEAYLNCGHEELAQAAEAWAHAHGYRIHRTGGSPEIRWGSL